MFVVISLSFQLCEKIEYTYIPSHILFIASKILFKSEVDAFRKQVFSFAPL